MKFKSFLYFAIFWCSFFFPLSALQLRDLFKDALPGDYIVAAHDKTNSLLHIVSHNQDRLKLEEITVPIKELKEKTNWKEWILFGAPGNTGWIKYDIDLASGQILHCYSVTKKEWFDSSSQENFLSTLLALQMTKIPESERKKVGPIPPHSSQDRRPLWQPSLVFEGKTLENVPFDAWRTHWPQDGSELANKAVIIYLPKEKGEYLSYFPYWIEVIGGLGKAKIRIKDSGRRMVSPKAP